MDIFIFSENEEWYRIVKFLVNGFGKTFEMLSDFSEMDKRVIALLKSGIPKPVSESGEA